jgi:membrane protease YdiL (CAAX protease family)
MDHIQSAAVKLGVSAALATFAYIRLRKTENPGERWGLQAPSHMAAGLAIAAIYFAWMLGTDLVTHWRGLWDFTPWIAAPLAASIMRVLAVCLFGPAAEELVFRGFLYGLLKDRIGIRLTIAITALGWAVLHFDYSWWVIGIIVVDGVLLGLARWRTGSVYLPIAMHALYNLYAIW